MYKQRAGQPLRRQPEPILRTCGLTSLKMDELDEQRRVMTLDKAERRLRAAGIAYLKDGEVCEKKTAATPPAPPVRAGWIN